MALWGYSISKIPAGEPPYSLCTEGIHTPRLPGVRLSSRRPVSSQIYICFVHGSGSLALTVKDC